MSKRKEQNAALYRRLKKQKRQDVLKGIGIVAAICLVVGIKTALTIAGIIDANSVVAGAVVMVAAIGLAIYGGKISVRITKASHEIKDLERKGVK